MIRAKAGKHGKLGILSTRMILVSEGKITWAFSVESSNELHRILLATFDLHAMDMLSSDLVPAAQLDRIRDRISTMYCRWKL